jgi:hypothetical protein
MSLLATVALNEIQHATFAPVSALLFHKAVLANLGAIAPFARIIITSPSISVLSNDK